MTELGGGGLWHFPKALPELEGRERRPACSKGESFSSPPTPPSLFKMSYRNQKTVSEDCIEFLFPFFPLIMIYLKKKREMEGGGVFFF